MRTSRLAALPTARSARKPASPYPPGDGWHCGIRLYPLVNIISAWHVILGRLFQPQQSTSHTCGTRKHPLLRACSSRRCSIIPQMEHMDSTGIGHHRVILLCHKRPVVKVNAIRISVRSAQKTSSIHHTS